MTNLDLNTVDLRDDDIAIVGMGCRFPGGANSPDAYWNMLLRGGDAIVDIPAERFDIDAYFDPQPGLSGKTYARQAGLIENIDMFDAEFFGLSRREAERMDPQQRLLLECAWEALQDGGIRLDRQASETGVFVGISTNDYAGMQAGVGEMDAIDIFTATGGAFSIAANRLSHVFGLGGPSLAVDTACSSALTAVHLAVRSLRAGDCKVALAGGVNALLMPTHFIAFSRMSMLSPDARCQAFDARANGFVRGEGAGLVALQPLRAALAEGRRIHAVIRGTAANQDGHTSSLTVPSAAAQRALVLAACQDAGVDPASIDYVEAHGTGTQVGDPIEASALGTAIGQKRGNLGPLLIGSSKTNIGHLESAAGAAGLIKAALVLSHGMVPPTLHFRTPSPNIDFATLNLQVVTEPTPLPRKVARVGVNSFGFGGSNAHLVLQTAPTPVRARSISDPEAVVLALSVAQPERAATVAGSWRAFIEGSQTPIADLCHAAATRLNLRSGRLAIAAPNLDVLLERLSALEAGEAEVAGVSQASGGAGERPVFVYSGQGTQWWGMARGLIGREPVFDAVLARADTLFAQWGGWSLIEKLSRDASTSQLDNTAFAQPAIFAVQAALTELWRSWGVEPAACVGHSVGEVAAAWAAGVLAFDEAARVIFHRGRCMEAAPDRGAMLAAALTEDAARSLVKGLSGAVSIGAVNSPGMVTLSGDTEAIAALAEDLEARGIFQRKLAVQYSFHSHHMEPVQTPLLAALGSVAVHPPRVPLMSTVTGLAADEGDFAAAYWWRNVREPVLFGPAIARLAAQSHGTFLEIGAHPALAGPITESARDSSDTAPLVLGSLRRQGQDRADMLASLGALWVRGQAVDWDGVLGGPRPLVDLPREVWLRKRFWNEAPSVSDDRSAHLRHPLIDRRIAGAQPVWQTRLDLQRLPWLEDHRVQGHVVFPAAGYLDMMLGAADTLAPEALTSGAGLMLDGADFRRMLVLPGSGEAVRLELRGRADTGGFELFSRDGGADWALNATGAWRAVDAGHRPQPLELRELRAGMTEAVAPDTLASLHAESGLNYGPAFRGLHRIARSEGVALGDVRMPEGLEDAGHALHPALLDACFQLLTVAIPQNAALDGGPFLPVELDHLWLYRRPGRDLVARVVVTQAAGRRIGCDITLCTPDGAPVAVLEGFRCQAVSRQRAGSPGAVEGWLHRQVWHPSPRAETPRAVLAPMHEVVAAAQAISARDSAPVGRVGCRVAMAEPIAAHVTDQIVAALRTLGWRFRAGKIEPLSELQTRLGIAPAHYRLFARFLSLLADDGIIALKDGQVQVLRAPRRAPLDRDWRSMYHQDPGLLPLLTLIRTCGAQLAAVLSGKANPLEVLFEGANQGVLEQFYQSDYTMVGYNTMAAEAVRAAVAAVPEGRAIRVLEIGAGTGGLSAHVLPHLPAQTTRYVYTDISNTFFTRAEKQFYDHRFVEFATLDIEGDPLAQGFDAESFDIILASDVFHATRDLGAALANARQLLAPGGLLAFIDIAQAPRSADLIFGMTAGWWRFDDNLRHDHPIPDRQTWHRAMAAAGYEQIEAIELAGCETLAGQMVMLARAPAVAASAIAPAIASGISGKPWLLLDDRAGTGLHIAERLRAEGRAVVLASPKPAPDTASDSGPTWNAPWSCTLDPHAPTQIAAMLDELQRRDLWPERVVFLNGLDAPELELANPAAIVAGHSGGTLALMRLVQALSAEGRAPTRLAVLTRNAQTVGIAGEAPVNPVAAPAWGLARVVMSEHRTLDCIAIDIDNPADPETLTSLLAELVDPGDEREIALRCGARFYNRIERVGFESLSQPDPAARHRLEIPAPGVLERLAFVARPRIAPGAGEVEIKVEAAALNFRDVMKAMGIYPTAGPEDELPGDECAGIVTAVGPATQGFAVGDRVLALGAGCFASYVTLPTALVFAMPAKLEYDAAVTIPVPFLTAWHALHEVARIRRGDTVLIHAATGGVGLAAVQVAMRAGATVLATAGSAGKRALLHALGVRHVMNSRTLGFADEVREITGGRGVDIILNALAGRAIEQGLASLAPGGRFLEIGKRDIYQNTHIGLRPFRHAISLTSIDLAQVMTTQPALAARSMRKVMRQIEAGRLTPLPYRSMPMARAHDAFRLVSQAKHIGKIVLSARDSRGVALAPRTTASVLLRDDATYVIGGGLGGFGLVLAEGLIRSGARHLVLIGRTGASSPEAARAVARLRAAGVTVRVEALNLAKETDVAAAFARIGAQMPPIRGIFHSAMVLDDVLLAQLTPARLARVMEPKVAGALALHRASRDLTLDHFVLFSSLAALIGSSGQANYVAANSFLVGLAQHRHAQGLPALAVDWGRISGAGHVALNDELGERLERAGLLGIPATAAVDALLRLMTTNSAHAALMNVDWETWRRSQPGEVPNRLANLVAVDDAAEGVATASLRDRLMSAREDSRGEIAISALRELVGAVLRLPPDEIDPEAALTDLGLDSLMAIDLVMRLEAALDISIPTSRVSTGLNLQDLAAMVLGLLSGAEVSTPTQAAPDGHPASDRAAPASCLVTLREGKGHVPLILVHPTGGDLKIYDPLVHAMPPGGAIFGLRSRAVAAGLEEYENAKQLARAYADLICTHLPEGPMALAGFSMGGFLALALTAELESRGREVLLTCAIDANPKWIDPKLDPADRLGPLMGEFITSIGAQGALHWHDGPPDRTAISGLIRKTTPLPEADRVQAFLDWLPSVGRTDPRIAPDQVRRIVALNLRHIGLFEGATFAPLSAPIWVFTSMSDAEASGFWPSLVKAGSKGEALVKPVRQVFDSDHLGILKPPVVSEIATALDDVIRANPLEPGSRYAAMA